MEPEIQYQNQTENTQNKKKGCRRIFLSFVIFLSILFLIGTIFLYKTSNTINKISSEKKSFIQNILSLIPGKTTFVSKLFNEEENINPFEGDRINYLLLGLRGAEDPNGGLLTDTIMVASINRKDNQLALISLPRDIYTEIPGTDKEYKINDAYAIGETKEWGKGGIELAKETVEKITGLKIHYAVSTNFDAFEDIINTLGGITVYVQKDFHESAQWEGKDVFIPKGYQTMDGQTALYYVRARYSTSDFDRARRQQDVLLSIKNKALNLGILANPVKINKLLDIIGNNIRMDMDMGELNQTIDIIQNINKDTIKRKVFDTSPNGLLYDSRNSEGSYILMPVGDNFDKIQEACKNIFN